jgi:hypothetical protein
MSCPERPKTTLPLPPMRLHEAGMEAAPVVAQGYGNLAALLAPRLSPISSRSSSCSTASFP